MTKHTTQTEAKAAAKGHTYEGDLPDFLIMLRRADLGSAESATAVRAMYSLARWADETGRLMDTVTGWPDGKRSNVPAPSVPQ